MRQEVKSVAMNTALRNIVPDVSWTHPCEKPWTGSQFLPTVGNYQDVGKLALTMLLQSETGNFADWMANRGPICATQRRPLMTGGVVPGDLISLSLWLSSD